MSPSNHITDASLHSLRVNPEQFDQFRQNFEIAMDTHGLITPKEWVEYLRVYSDFKEAYRGIMETILAHHPDGFNQKQIKRWLAQEEPSNGLRRDLQYRFALAFRLTTTEVPDCVLNR